MEQLNLPFRLGMDYEELEFDLEILPDRIQGYDSYIYLGKFNDFLNYTTDKIELLFRIDILEGIIISYNYLSYESYNLIMSQVSILYGSPKVLSKEKYTIYAYEIAGFIIEIVFTKEITYIILFAKKYCIRQYP